MGFSENSSCSVEANPLKKLNCKIKIEKSSLARIDLFILQFAFSSCQFSIFNSSTTIRSTCGVETSKLAVAVRPLKLTWVAFPRFDLGLVSAPRQSLSHL